MSVLFQNFNHRLPAFFIEDVDSLTHKLIHAYTSHLGQLLDNVGLSVRQNKMDVLFADECSFLWLGSLLDMLALLFNIINFSNTSNILAFSIFNGSFHMLCFSNLLGNRWGKHLLSRINTP